jgi:hypothetical protein
MIGSARVTSMVHNGISSTVTLETVVGQLRSGLKLVNDRVLPSGSVNQATESPLGVVQIPFESCV